MFRGTGDVNWLQRLYPRAAEYIRWWLNYRRDGEGWEISWCSGESGQDMSSRFGPQQTGGTIIEHVHPVDLQASMALSALLLARWATLLARHALTMDGQGMETVSGQGRNNFAADAALWQDVANDFTIKSRLMWRGGWFLDYDSVAGGGSTPQDAIHLGPGFFGVDHRGHLEQPRPFLARPP